MQTKKLFTAAVGTLMIVGTLAGLATQASSKEATTTGLPMPSQQAVLAAAMDQSTATRDPYVDGADQSSQYNGGYYETRGYYGTHGEEEHEGHKGHHQREREEDDD